MRTPLVILTVTTAIAIVCSSSISLADQNVLLVIQKGNGQTIDVLKKSLGGVKLNMNIKEVTNILGKPRQIVQGHDDTCVGDYTTLKYNKLEIRMVGKKENTSVISISTFNSAYSTGEGIRSGDRISKVKITYAKFRSENRDRSLVYDGESYSGLSFKVRDGLVAGITLFLPGC